MKRTITLIVTLCTLLTTLYAQRPYMSRAEFTKWCEDELHSDQFGSLPYRIARFDKRTNSAPALVVWFHGGHSSGCDNKRHIGTNTDAVGKLARYLQTVEENTVLAAPHCSEQMRDESDQTAIMLCRWIDYLVEKEGIDRDKIYLIGASFGGMLVSKISSARPDIPAAIEIIATVPHIRNATKDDFALCCVASDEGNLRKFDRIEQTIYQLHEAGFDIRYIVRPGLSHQEICQVGLDKTTLDWLFSH